MFGLLFFVPLLGMAVGAAMGALAGSMSDVGIDDRFVEEVREKVTPGTSALFVMTSRVVEDRVLEEFRDTRAELISTNLSREQEDRRGGPNHARLARGAVGETVELQVMRAWSDKAGRPGARTVQDVVEGRSQRTRWVVRNLLVQHFGGLEAAGSVRRARAGRDGPAWGPVATALRERTVLALLPSLLSLEEIGAELTVPINTVKTYVRSIYNKLGISCRRTAVLAGHDHGLIVTPPAGTGYPVTLSG